MNYDWISSSAIEIGSSLLSLAIVYAVIIALTRIFGLRSFSKMTASDFAMTVAVGSLLASSVATRKPPILQAVVVFIGWFFTQWLIAFARRNSKHVAKLVDNTPILLMDGPNILYDNLSKVNVTREDLFAKLRISSCSSRGRRHQVRVSSFELR